MHNHVINSAKALSFRHVKEEVCKKLVNLFKDEHLPSSVLHIYEDTLHLNTTNE